MNANKSLYWILAILSMTGYVWIGLHFFSPVFRENTVSVCLIKNVTGVPCPSCGITRSVLLLVSGDIKEAIFINPLGIVAVVALVIIPLWIVKDALTRKSSLAPLFRSTELKIKTKKSIYIPLAALALLNWAWNIFKDL